MPSFRFIACALLGAAALLGSVAPAQAEPPWWRVSDGHSEVWILGAPRIVPKDLAWDTGATEKRLAGVNTVIVGPRARNSLKAASLVFASFSNQPLESTLPPGLHDRFVAVRQSLGRPAGRYSNWRPAAASKFLLDDFFQTQNLQQGGVEAAVVRLAHAHGVHDVPAGEFDSDTLIDQAKALGQAQQIICLDAAVHDVERGPAVIRTLAAGWTRGAVTDAPIDPIDQSCVSEIPAIGAQAQRTLAQESDAVAQALNSPGHAIAVFELHSLTQPGGVLDRLRARGLQVTGPRG